MELFVAAACNEGPTRNGCTVATSLSYWHFWFDWFGIIPCWCWLCYFHVSSSLFALYTQMLCIYLQVLWCLNSYVLHIGCLTWLKRTGYIQFTVTCLFYSIVFIAMSLIVLVCTQRSTIYLCSHSYAHGLYIKATKQFLQKLECLASFCTEDSGIPCVVPDTQGSHSTQAIM